MERELDNVGYEWKWKDIPDKQRWIVAWGVLWRIWIFSIGMYAVLLVVFLLFVAVASVAQG